MTDLTKMEFHHYAEMFPLIEGKEFDKLVEDIKINKLQVPITKYQGKILDGRNRYRAAIEAKYPLKEEDFTDYKGYKPLEFVISTNIHRRHLNESQRAMIAAKLVTTKLGDNQQSKATTIEDAAKMLNVSDASVKTAKEVWTKGAPEVQAAVQGGKKRLGAVKKLLDLPAKEQVKKLTEAKKHTTTAAFDGLEKKWDAADLLTRKALVEAKYQDIKMVVQVIELEEAEEKKAKQKDEKEKAAA